MIKNSSWRRRLLGIDEARKQFARNSVDAVYLDIWALSRPEMAINRAGVSLLLLSFSFVKREREREGSEKLNDLENSVINKSWLFSFREKEFEIHRMGLELEIIPSLDYARERKEKRTVSNWRGWPEPFTKDRFESSGAIREITTSSLGWPLLSAQLIYDDRAKIELERFRRWDSFNYGSSSPSYYLTGNYFNSRPFTVLVIIHITLHATLQRFKVHFSSLSDINNFVIWISFEWKGH